MYGMSTIIRSKFLSIDAWFSLGTDKDGKRYLIKKRVSAARAAHFPEELRDVFREAYKTDYSGVVKFVKHLMKSRNLRLAQAWDETKRLFNDYPRGN